MSKLCLFTLQCDVCNKTCLVNCYYSFAFLSKIAFRVLPRPNFFYITFFVVNATVVFFFSCISSIVFVCLFLGFKFPNRSQKLICLIFVWFVCFFFMSLKAATIYKRKQSEIHWKEMPDLFAVSSQMFQMSVSRCRMCLSQNYPVFANGFF